MLQWRLPLVCLISLCCTTAVAPPPKCPWHLITCENNRHPTMPCIGIYGRNCKCPETSKDAAAVHHCSKQTIKVFFDPPDCLPAPHCIVRPTWCSWGPCDRVTGRRKRSLCCHPGSGHRLTDRLCLTGKYDNRSSSCEKETVKRNALSTISVSLDVFVSVLAFIIALSVAIFFVKHYYKTHRAMIPPQCRRRTPENNSVRMMPLQPLPGPDDNLPPSYEDSTKMCDRPSQPLQGSEARSE